MTFAFVAGGRRFSALPLAVTLAIHVLLAWWWLSSTGRRPVEAAGRQLVSVLVDIPQPARPPPPAPPAHDTRGPARARAATPAPAAPREVPATAIPPAEAAAAPVEQPLAAPLSPEADAFLLNAKKQAGAIDRELRGGKSGVPREADTPWAKFQNGIAGAYKDTSRTSLTETYTAPDGAVYYRHREGNKVWCRKGGSVEPDMIGRSAGAVLAGAGSWGGARTAGTVPCPSSEVGWRRN